MKVTTEKLPKSLLALEIELDREQVEKGLERAARRLSQKYNIPGFRKGKAPRFIVENYFGRPALIEEASEDLVNKAFKAALEQENIDPIGQANLEHVHLEEVPFHFRVTVPVAPTVTLPDYRAINVPLTVEEVTDEMVERAMDARRERHAVLREPEEPRPAQDGDQLSVELEAIVDGEPLEPREPGTPIQPSTLVLEKDRLVEGLYDGLLGATIDQSLEIQSHMPADHTNEKLRDKDVTFAIKVLGIQERLLPDWEELAVLEEFEGTLDELREKTRNELLESAKNAAERTTLNSYIEQLVEQTSYDIPDVLVEREADSILRQQEQEYTRYGVKPEQVYEMRGQKREDLIQTLLPQGESRLKTALAMQEVMRNEGITLSSEEFDAELETMLNLYSEDQRDSIRQLLTTNLSSMVTESALDKKLRAHVIAIANGTAPEPQAPTEASDESESEPITPTEASSTEAASEPEGTESAGNSDETDENKEITQASVQPS